MRGIQIPIRELHARTGHFVRKAADMHVVITDNGKPIAEIRPLPAKASGPTSQGGKSSQSYWNNRDLTPGFRRVSQSGVLRPSSEDKPLDEILDEIKEDSTA